MADDFASLKFSQRCFETSSRRTRTNLSGIPSTLLIKFVEEQGNGLVRYVNGFVGSMTNEKKEGLWLEIL